MRGARIAIEVGVDQFGGDRNPALIEGSSTLARCRSHASTSPHAACRVRSSVSACSKNRRVDVNRARKLCSSPTYFEKGMAAQRASLVFLSDGAPPILDNARLFVEGMEDIDGFETVTDPAAADAILVRLDAPFEKAEGRLLATTSTAALSLFPGDPRPLGLVRSADTTVYFGIPGTSGDRRTVG